MTAEKTRILSALQVKQKIERIAHEIHEYNYSESEIIMVGIANRGYQLAEAIHGVLVGIADFDVKLIQLSLDKDDPLHHAVELDLNREQAQGKVVLLVDDVLNTGKTLIYAVRHLLDLDVKVLKTVILVNRRHRQFPIRADYVGLTLATTMQEHIQVVFEGNDIEVFLD